MTDTVTDVAPARPDRAATRADIAVLATQAVLVAVAVAVGAYLNRRHVPIHADAAPLFATWLPHVGPGTPLAIAIAVLVVYRGPAWAARLTWPRLMTGAYLTALVWTLSLALIDGWSRGLATRLTPQAEYLHDVPKVTSIPAMLAGFTSHIIDFRPLSWATHVAGHPPGALLVFVVLERIGLRGGGPAALLCVLVGAAAPIAVAVTLRALRDEPAARAALPFLVLFPGAVWVGASADGLFTGMLAAGLALLAVGGWRLATVPGLLLGFSLYLSYGLVLAGPLALAVIALKPQARWATAAAATAGAGTVVVAFSTAGFWWPTGYHLVVARYYQGWTADRPYDYWVWTNLAGLILSAGPGSRTRTTPGRVGHHPPEARTGRTLPHPVATRARAGGHPRRGPVRAEQGRGRTDLAALRDLADPRDRLAAGRPPPPLAGRTGADRAGRQPPPADQLVTHVSRQVLTKRLPRLAKVVMAGAGGPRGCQQTARQRFPRPVVVPFPYRSPVATRLDAASWLEDQRGAAGPGPAWWRPACRRAQGPGRSRRARPAAA